MMANMQQAHVHAVSQEKTYDEGCADDPEDWCIAVGDMADYVVENRQGRSLYH